MFLRSQVLQSWKQDTVQGINRVWAKVSGVSQNLGRWINYFTERLKFVPNCCRSFLFCGTLGLVNQKCYSIQENVSYWTVYCTTNVSSFDCWLRLLHVHCTMYTVQYVHHSRMETRSFSWLKATRKSWLIYSKVYVRVHCIHWPKIIWISA